MTSPAVTNFASLVLLFSAVLLCSAQSVGARGGFFSWKDCGKSDRKVKFNSVQVAPDPLIYGKSATVSMGFQVLEPLDDLTATSVLEKKVIFFWPKEMKDCPDDVGTCTFSDLCKTLKDSQAGTCQGDLPCDCPIEAKTYDVTRKIVAPKNPAGWFGTGSFYYKFEVTQRKNNIGCLELYFDMEDH